MVKASAYFLGKAAFWAAFVCLCACSDAPSDDLDSGGLTPPPGFLERVDANCRLAATDVALTDASPDLRQLNGQSLLSYTSADGDTVVCAVRHSDESVIDIRLISSE